MASNAALKNEWHHRKVAEGQAKACWICFKPSTSVLITPDSKVGILKHCFGLKLIAQDFFYVCPGHLKDRGFAIQDAAEAAAFEERKKKEAMDHEIEAVKREFAEKQKEKEKRRKERAKKTDKDKKKEEKKEDEEEDKSDEKERDEKV